MQKKLVRNKIPEIMKQKGKKPSTHIASDEEYWSKLKEKLQEETAEFNKNSIEEEYVDILEVLEAIKEFKGFDEQSLKDLKKKKVEERGKFKDKIILEGAE